MNDTVFRAIADPQRRRILQLLRKGPLNAGQLAAGFEITKGSLSYHFNILKDADLIRCTRRGQEQLYELNTSVMEDLAATLAGLFQSRSPRRLKA